MRPIDTEKNITNHSQSAAYKYMSFCSVSHSNDVSWGTASLQRSECSVDALLLIMGLLRACMPDLLGFFFSDIKPTMIIHVIAREL